MSLRPNLYFWKQLPFLRLIIPLIAGILVQEAFCLANDFLYTTAFVIALILVSFLQLTISRSYAVRWVPGFAIHLALAVFGALLVNTQNITSKKRWVGKMDPNGLSPALLITLQEPLVQKAKTFKAEATINAIKINGEWKNVDGNILVYLGKQGIKNVTYGSTILFNKPLQPIRNSGNPAAFNYKQYNAFRGIHHQVFLKANEYIIAKTTNRNAFKNRLFIVRKNVIQKLRQYVKDEREAGVAEALLIGYRDDLDKDLVQAYSNTGVVHIIAISGLHLGMIYMSLVWILSPFKRTKWIRWVKPVIILVVLWIFTLLAGAVPSILRSAVMFSFIVIGETINRKSSVYNMLASSAFVMLCINPYYLWDIGFQLSYAAVTSIVTFVKPIYNWFYFKNKLIDFIWKLTSVTLAAQVLTVPIIFYAFHQFPTVFLITNVIVVPLSSVILFAELILLSVSFVPVLATVIGIITTKMLAFMNDFIVWVNELPYAVYEGIQNNLPQTIMLYVFIIALACWLLQKSKPAFFTGLSAILIFIIIDGIEIFNSRKQQKIVVYNVPQHRAIDFISGRNYAFAGDSVLNEDNYLRNFNLKPGRTFYKAEATKFLTDLFISYPFIQYKGKRIVVIDKSYKFETINKISLDLVILSHNPSVNMAQISSVFNCRQVVFDASNSQWKINQWKKDCDSLHLPNYSTISEGAYVQNL